jgi:hypothetical protein
VDAAVGEALAAEAWVDVMTLVPGILNPSDVFSLLQACPSLKRQKV